MATRMFDQKLTTSIGSNIRLWFTQFEVFVKHQGAIVEPAIEAVPENLNADAEARNAWTAERDRRNERNVQLQWTQTLIVSMDAAMFKKAYHFAKPEDITTTEYKVIKQKLCNHYSPKPTKFAQRYAFTRIFQVKGERVAEYVERLTETAMDCEFENELESRMLDQFIAGLSDESVKAKLLKKTDLTLAAAREHVATLEKSVEEAQYMSKNSVTARSSGTVNKVSDRKSNKFRKESSLKPRGEMYCEKCTLRSHNTRDCKTVCRKCKEKYHIARNCTSTKKKYKFRKGDKSHHVEESSETDENDESDVEIAFVCVEEKSVDMFRVRDSEIELNEIEKLEYSKLLPSEDYSEFDTVIDYDDSNLDACDDSSSVELIDNQEIVEFNCNHTSAEKLLVSVKLNGRDLNMEFDSGSSVSIVSCNVLSKVGLDLLPLIPSAKRLRAANNERLPVMAKAQVDVEFNGKMIPKLDLFIVEGKCPSLMGQSWITRFLGDDWLETTLKRSKTDSSSCFDFSPCVSKSVNVTNVHVSPVEVQSCVSLLPLSQRPSERGDQRTMYMGTVTQKTEVQKPLRSLDELKNSPIFEEGLGLIKGAMAKLVLKDDHQPKSLGVRTLPYAKKDQVGKELTRMLNEGILTRVEGASLWGTPIVPVFKGEKTRICGSYNLTLNPAMAAQQYPLPSIEECLNKVTGGQQFTKLDVRAAYNNIPIRKEDRILTTINTHLGQLMWNRLPYGISPAAAIFQETIDQTLAGIPMCCCRVDDILVSGKTQDEHLRVLNTIISRLENQGYRCKPEKSEFMQDSVIYLGHTVNKDGIKPVKSKVEDLLKMKVPKSVDELVSFLGGVNYYRRYIANMSQIIAPLDELRKKGVKWKWGKEQQKSWEKLRNMLSSETVLTLYNPNLPLKLDTDASSHGLGAVLSHVMPDGTERPVEYISRTLTSAEKNYSQIDKEATAIVWGVKRFHLYLYGRKFKLVTDNQPLVHIFNKNKQLSVMTAARLTRWSLFLMDYDYDICYRPTKAHGNADMLSRLPRPHTREEENETENDWVQSVDIENTGLMAKNIESHTRKDPVLSKIVHYVKNGWPDRETNFTDEMTAYWNRRNDISMENGCLTWGCRVIIPVKLRTTVLEMLHATHLGISRMKTLARSYVYWPLINSEIEQIANTCTTCGKHGKSLPSLIEHPWTRPSMPWQRVHIDYAGPFLNSMWLVVYDAHSRWPEVVKMNNNTTSSATIRALRTIFSRFGLPFVIVSDNGTNFTSQEFEDFLQRNNIHHLKTGTYHPKSNGCCERFVGTFKNAMKKMYENCKDVDKNLANFLVNYRITPHSVTGIPPSEALFKKLYVRTRMNHVFPADRETSERLNVDKEQEILNASKIRNRQFEEKQKVYVQPQNKDTWSQGEIQRRIGNSNMYEVMFDGRNVIKHADHIKQRSVPVLQPAETSETDNSPETECFTSPNSSTVVLSEQLTDVDLPNTPLRTNEPELTNNNPSSGEAQETNQTRRSERLARKPKRSYEIYR